MATQVLIGPEASAIAGRFCTQQDALRDAVQTLLGTGALLIDPGTWCGDSQARFQAELEQLKGHLAQIEGSLERLGAGAQAVINRIDTEDLAGASSFGTFTG